MKFTIDTPDQQLKIRYAAQLLNAITLMDDAISMSEEVATELVERLNDILPDRSLGDELKQLGKGLLEKDGVFDLDNIDRLLMDLVIQESVNTCAGSDDLELEELSAGSIRGQIRKVIDKYRTRLKQVLTSLKDLLPAGDPVDFKASVAPVLATSTLTQDGQETAAGVMGVAAVQTRDVLRDSNANGVHVEDLEEHGAAMSMA